jgi:hypothetical protein
MFPGEVTPLLMVWDFGPSPPFPPVAFAGPLQKMAGHALSLL